MTHRPLRTILAEWRTLDRQRDAMKTATDRIELDRALAALTAEYREAQAAPQTERPTADQRPALSGVH
jgi:hypothetical protein